MGLPTQPAVAETECLAKLLNIIYCHGPTIEPKKLFRVAVLGGGGLKFEIML